MGKRVVNLGLPQWLNIYELDENYIKQNARCKIFTAYDNEWLKFIVKVELERCPGENMITLKVVLPMTESLQR